MAQRQDSEALESTITAIKAGLDARGVRYEDISGRPKSLYGVWQKMRASGKLSLDQVGAVGGVRACGGWGVGMGMGERQWGLCGGPDVGGVGCGNGGGGEAGAETCARKHALVPVALPGTSRPLG